MIEEASTQDAPFDPRTPLPDGVCSHMIPLAKACFECAREAGDWTPERGWAETTAKPEEADRGR